jgi:gas vesicle protein
MSTALKWKLIAGFLLVFVAGGLTGGFIGAHHARNFFLGPPHSHGLPERMRERLRRQLELTPDQVSKISPIIDQTSSKLEAIRIETAQRVRATLEESHRQIAPQLTPEQREKLEKMEQMHKKRMRHHGFPAPEQGEPPP